MCFCKTKQVLVGLNCYENPKIVQPIVCSGCEGGTCEWFLIGVESQTTAGSVLKSDYLLILEQCTLQSFEIFCSWKLDLLFMFCLCLVSGIRRNKKCNNIRIRSVWKTNKQTNFTIEKPTLRNLEEQNTKMSGTETRLAIYQKEAHH